MGNLISRLLLTGGIAGTLGIGNLNAQDTIYNLDGSIDKLVAKDNLGGFIFTEFKNEKKASQYEFDFNKDNRLEFCKKYEEDSLGRTIVKEDKEGDGRFNLIFREDPEKNITEIDSNADGVYDKIHPTSNYYYERCSPINYSPEKQKQILLNFKNFIKEKGQQATGLYGKPIYSYKTKNVAEKKAKFSATLEANNIKNIETFIVSKENNPNDSLKTFSTKHTFIDYGANGLKTKEDEYNWVDNRVKPKEDSRFLEFTSLPKDGQTHVTSTYFDLLVEIMEDAKGGEY